MVCRFKKDHKNFERFSWLQMFDNILARLRCFSTISNQSKIMAASSSKYLSSIFRDFLSFLMDFAVLQLREQTDNFIICVFTLLASSSACQFSQYANSTLSVFIPLGINSLVTKFRHLNQICFVSPLALVTRHWLSARRSCR